MRCEYGVCYLPDNNNRYWWQLVYLLISAAYLAADRSQFTFVSLFMFTVPIILDLISADFPIKIYNCIKKVYLVLNVAIGIFCMLGMFGAIIDDGVTFAVSPESMLFSNVGIEKTAFLVPLLIDLFIPIMMRNASPSKNTKWIIEQSREQRKVGSV